MILRFAAAVLAVSASALLPLPADESPAAKTHVVSIAAMRFTPEILDVAIGDTVVWQNDDIVLHTATAEGGAFDSGPIPRGERFAFRADREGELSYACLYHPTMKGAIRVASQVSRNPDASASSKQR